MPNIPTANRAVKVLDGSDVRKEIFLQCQGPGTATFKKGSPPVNLNDGYQVKPGGHIKGSGPHIFKGEWYVMVDTANTFIFVDETTT